MMAGAAAAAQKYNNADLATNESYQYAAVRNALYRKGKSIELLANFEPSLHFVSEWWKQLFGESEGKDQKGLYPASVDFTTDLHSMGQYVQEGRRDLIETVLAVKKPRVEWTIEADAGNLDGLNFLAGMTMDEVNKKAAERHAAGACRRQRTEPDRRARRAERIYVRRNGVLLRESLRHQRPAARREPVRPTGRGSLQGQYVRPAGQTRLRSAKSRARKTFIRNRTGMTRGHLR